MKSCLRFVSMYLKEADIFLTPISLNTISQVSRQTAMRKLARMLRRRISSVRADELPPFHALGPRCGLSCSLLDEPSYSRDAYRIETSNRSTRRLEGPLVKPRVSTTANTDTKSLRMSLKSQLTESRSRVKNLRIQLRDQCTHTTAQTRRAGLLGLLCRDKPKVEHEITAGDHGSN
jgi:hypothetical protein